MVLNNRMRFHAVLRPGPVVPVAVSGPALAPTRFSRRGACRRAAEAALREAGAIGRMVTIYGTVSFGACRTASRSSLLLCRLAVPSARPVPVCGGDAGFPPSGFASRIRPSGPFPERPFGAGARVARRRIGAPGDGATRCAAVSLPGRRACGVFFDAKVVYKSFGTLSRFRKSLPEFRFRAVRCFFRRRSAVPCRVSLSCCVPPRHRAVVPLEIAGRGSDGVRFPAADFRVRPLGALAQPSAACRMAATGFFFALLGMHPSPSRRYVTGTDAFSGICREPGRWPQSPPSRAVTLPCSWFRKA